ncbi:MAG: response regulator [Thermodesulfobacteriota bacterium]|nr:response regulator [Thermodesulfobacteriota bacterium]
MEKKSLVVDNDPVMLKWITNLLEKEGYQVLTGEDGLSALDILKTYRPDIIFTDLIMPNIDGEKLCEMIRKDPDLKNVFLVVFSATASEEETNILQFGADLCIAKCSFDKMTKHIQKALDEVDRRAPVAGTGHVIGLEDSFPRQITKELLSDRKHFEVILGSMAEGILEITPQGRIVYSNPSAVSLIGIPEEKLLASNLLNLFHDKDQERMKGLLSTFNTHRKTVNGDPPLQLDGKQVSLSLLPILDKEHRTTIILLNDVSERKKMETQLLQAQKMEAIGTLAGGIAHDFNNLLMVVQGNVSLMLLDMNPSHPHYEMLRSIEKKVQNGSRLTAQLLGYARKGRYEVKPILLNQLVEETAEAFGRTRKNIVIHMDLYRDLHPLEADPGQMEQVLMNLLVNAADAMPVGGNLFLKTANVTHLEIQGDLYEAVPGNYVLLSVTDTGIGMDRKTMERIFDPFFTTKELGRGTGLGLASVYGIIKGHNGYINVRSEAGKGATFLTYLPASEGKVEEQIKKDEEVLMGRETVLLVDDEEHVLDVGEKILKTLGYKVLIADRGEKAVELYKTNRDQIDLVILDLIMPQKGGGETFDALREIHSEMKVLLSSGYSMNGQTEEIMRRGCKGFIQKPFSIKELSQKLREILDKK